MMRNLKVLGLALVAMLAMSVVASSVASADTFTGEVSPATLTGSQEEGTTDVFTITAGNTSCKEVNYTGTSASGVTTITATPSYPEKTKTGVQNCTSLGVPALIHTNGCTYLFHIGAATDGTLDINCPAGKEITVTAGYNVTTKCTIHVPAQTGLSKISFSNTGVTTTREVTVTAAIGNLKYTHVKGSGIGACPTGSGTTGSYTGKALVTGEKDNGGFEHVGIFVS